MLEMRPVYTSYEREEYTAVFGIKPEDGKVVICARYPEKFVGMAYVAHKVPEKTAVVELLSLVPGYEDDTDIFLLGKAMLNYLDLHGVERVFYPDVPEQNLQLAKRLGFHADETGGMSLNLTGYFTAHH